MTTQGEKTAFLHAPNEVHIGLVHDYKPRLYLRQHTIICIVRVRANKYSLLRRQQTIICIKLVSKVGRVEIQQVFVVQVEFQRRVDFFSALRRPAKRRESGKKNIKVRTPHKSAILLASERIVPSAVIGCTGVGREDELADEGGAPPRTRRRLAALSALSRSFR